MKGREISHRRQLFDGKRFIQRAVDVVDDFVDSAVVDGGGFVHWGG